MRTARSAVAVAVSAAERTQQANLLDVLGSFTATTAEVEIHGFAWESLLLDQQWRMTSIYAEATLDYAWIAAVCASRLTICGTLTPLADWPENLRHPDLDWLTADPGHRIPMVHLAAPAEHRAPWYVEEIARLNGMLVDAHARIHASLVRVLKVYPDDLRAGSYPGDQPRLALDDTREYEPRCARLHEAAAALHAYAASCARAVALSTFSPVSGHGG